MEKKAEIVSLGVNCLPRTILTRNKIKPSKAQGELSCPFDLVKHPIERIIYYLENDFENYTDDLFFVVRKRNFLDFRNKGIWQKPDGTKFFHDKDCKKNDLEKLTTRITKRIENFRKIVDAETPILFVLCIFEKTDLIERLYSVIKQLRKDKKFALAIINFSDDIIEPQTGIYSLNLVQPCNNYANKWNTKKLANSRTGIYIDTCISSFIKLILEKNF